MHNPTHPDPAIIRVLDLAQDASRRLAVHGVEVLGVQGESEGMPILLCQPADWLWTLPDHRRAFVVPFREARQRLEVWIATFHGCLIGWKRMVDDRIVIREAGHA